jgi:putative heme-binding domain-containing protein
MIWCPFTLFNDRTVVTMPFTSRTVWIFGGLVVVACGVIASFVLWCALDGPHAVTVWAAGPMEVRAVFDVPIDPFFAWKMTGRSIPFGEPSGNSAEPRLATSLGRVRIAAARLDHDGRTLVLSTDLHSRAATYLLHVPAIDSKARSTVWGKLKWRITRLCGGSTLAYNLDGVEASWSGGSEGAGAEWTSWWPQIDPASALALAERSTEYQQTAARLTHPGRLTIRTLLVLPRGKVTVGLESDAPIVATLALEPPPQNARAHPDGRHRTEWELQSTGEPVELVVTIPTGINGKPPALNATYRTEADSGARPIPSDRQIPPWVPPPTPASAPAPKLPISLAGGDRGRGEAIFNSSEARCSGCHKLHGRGGDTGPALDGLAQRDPATVYRDIAEPSAVINPEYRSCSVVLKDGRVMAGVVRADGLDAIRVHDVNGHTTTIPRFEIDELRPSSTSVMPYGLAATLGEARMRDLLVFLTGSTAQAVASIPRPAPAASDGVVDHAPATPVSGPGGDHDEALPRLAIELAFPNVVFDKPLATAFPDDGGRLLFVVEQPGCIWSLPDEHSTTDKSMFLDFRAKVLSAATGGHSDEGLVSLAFHPNYRNNRELFIYYASAEGPTGRRSILSRLKVSRNDPRRADPASEERIWVGPPDPYGNHNGGTLVFGPDGYLYFSLGDGGPADDPLTTGQNPSDWFGSILRIDVDHSGDGKQYGIPADNPRLRDPKRFAAWAPEVYCIGLRNVWKFSFERRTGTLWAGDVGQDLWEIVHIIENGGNYGWSIMEGFKTFRPRQRRDPASPISRPLVVHPHSPNQAGSDRVDDGKSITGGFVYRGRDLPELAGIYVYGDYLTGRIWGLRAHDGNVVANGELIERRQYPPLNIASFGEDHRGELLILAYDGHLYKLVRRN